MAKAEKYKSVMGRGALHQGAYRGDQSLKASDAVVKLIGGGQQVGQLDSVAKTSAICRCDPLGEEENNFYSCVRFEARLLFNQCLFDVLGLVSRAGEADNENRLDPA